MKRNKLLFILLILNYFSWANDSTIVSSSPLQDTTKFHYLAISLGYNYYKHLDHQISPILYKGGLMSLQLSFESDGLQNKYKLSLGGSYGNLKGETYHVTYPASQALVNLHFDFLHRIKPQPKQIRKYIGASIYHDYTLHINPNLQNAAYTMSFFNSIAFSGALEKQFSWKSKTLNIWFLKFKRRNRTLKVLFKADIPIYFFNLRPPYSTINDFSNGESSLNLDSKSFFIGKNAFQLNMNTNIVYYLNNHNALRVSYLWQAYKFTDTFSSYQSAQHLLQFSLLFKLN